MLSVDVSTDGGVSWRSAGKVTVTFADYASYSVFVSEHDYATRGKLAWFVAEQVEEEETARNLIDRLKLIGSDGLAL